MYNALVSLEDDPRFKEMIGFDRFAITPALLRTIDPTVWDLNENLGFPRAWQDNDSLRIVAMLQEQGINVTPEHVNQALPLVAKAIPFHPVIERLDSLEWDGAPGGSIAGWSNIAVSKTSLCRAVGARFLISAVARVLCQVSRPIAPWTSAGQAGAWQIDRAANLFDPGFDRRDCRSRQQGLWQCSCAVRGV